MKQVTQYEMADGSCVLIEVDELGSGRSVTPAGRPGEIAAKAKAGFEEALSSVLPALKHVTSQLRELQPEECEIEFGIKFNTQVGAMIAAIASEANLNVKVKWSRESGHSASS